MLTLKKATICSGDAEDGRMIFIYCSNDVEMKMLEDTNTVGNGDIEVGTILLPAPTLTTNSVGKLRWQILLREKSSVKQTGHDKGLLWKWQSNIDDFTQPFSSIACFLSLCNQSHRYASRESTEVATVKRTVDCCKQG